MKKSITKSDGTVEILEGTPEEFAEYEKILGEKIFSQNVGKKILDGITNNLKKVLNEAK